MNVSEAMRKELRFIENNNKICFRLRCDELISEPEVTHRKIFQFLDESREDDVLSYIEFDHNYGI